MGKYHPNVDPYVVSRVRALESLLLEKGILALDTVDKVVSRFENDTGPMIGARAVARAWVDPEYKRRLLTNAAEALRDFDLTYDLLVVIENTPQVHNLVVCTLCSCYPLAGAGTAADLVQVAAVPVAGGDRTAGPAAGLWSRDPRGA